MKTALSTYILATTIAACGAAAQQQQQHEQQSQQQQQTSTEQHGQMQQQGMTQQQGTAQQPAQQQFVGMWYNPGAETTIKGVVRSVSRQRQDRLGRGTHISVRADDGVVHDVFLGPRDFVRSNGLRPNRGDEVEITGYRAVSNGNTIFLAREVRLKDRTFALRNEQGIPNWGGAVASPAQPSAARAMAIDPNITSAEEYDPAFETTIRGTVEQTSTFSRAGMQDYSYAVVRTDDGRRINVKLAPSSFLQQQQLSLNQGDQVTISGSLLGSGADQHMLAREVRAGNRVVALRSLQGVPSWPETAAVGQAAREMTYPQVEDADKAARMEGAVYNRGTETTLDGTIEDIRVYSRPGAEATTHATLRTQDGAMTVLLGPLQFINERGVALQDGDRVRVTGSRVEFEGQDTLIARQIVKDGNSVLMRNEAGQPLWGSAPQVQQQQHEQRR